MRLPPIATVTATKDRADLLLGRSAPSIAAQTLRPERVIVVNDGARLRDATLSALREQLGQDRLTTLDNARQAGPGGAWNTALDHLRRTSFEGFVALLDDDDEWSPEHLLVNAQAATRANLVVSGLRLVIDGRAEERPLISALRAEDFLVGNPGWQGSNTFLSLALLSAAAGFRDDLTSLHDRDLALRVLSHPATRPALVPRWTATWHLCTRSSLSAPRSPAKRAGLRQFWQLYGSRMSRDQREAFFDRAHRLFGVTPAEVMGRPAESHQ